MKFLYPQFLYAFAVLLIPILLHLFHLKRYKTLYFSSIQFLKQVDTHSKSARKIKQLLVLFARLLAFSCLVLAFAQPYFSDKSNEAKKDAIYCIYIDNSFSMQALGVEGQLLSQAKEIAQKIISNNSPTTKYIITSNTFSPEEQIIQSKVDAVDYIEKLDFSYEKRTIQDVAELQSSLLIENNEEGQFVWISDGQVNAWKIKQLNIKENVFPLILTPQNKNNLSVDSVWTSSPIRQANQKMELNIKITNNSKSNIKSAQIKVLIDSNLQSQTVNFDANNQGIIQLNYLTPNIGLHTLSITIEDDSQLLFDNELFGSFSVNSHQKIGLVQGENAPENIAIVYGLDDYYQLDTQNKEQLNFEVLKKDELLIINNVEDIEPGLSESLEKYVQNGGNLALIPSEKCNTSSWNSLLSALQMPLIEKSDSSTSYIQTIHQEHPFFDGVFEQNNQKIHLPVRRTTILKDYVNAHFLPLLDYSDESPCVAISTNQKGKVFLFNSDFNKQNSNLLQSDLFSTLFLRIAEFSSDASPLYLTLGKSSNYKINATTNGENPLKIIVKKSSFIPEQIDLHGSVLLSFNGSSNEQLLQQGIYNVMKENTIKGKIAFNYDRSESKTDYLTVNEVTKLLKNKGVSNVQSTQIEEVNKISTIDFNKPNKLWRILLILSVIFFLIEMILIKVFNI